MFTDTHCHLLTMQQRGIELDKFFKDYVAQKDVPFLLDIGTVADDFERRQDLSTIAKDACNKDDFLHFSLGIWPDDDAVQNFDEHVKILQNTFARYQEHLATKKIVALGECGLDRNWNKADKGAKYLHQEEELFAMQIALANELNLPLIVHSRDDFDATLAVMKNASPKSAIIHCFSYGKKEAKAFLDAGYRLSLSGSITFGKKAKDEENAELARYIPLDRLLLETDAPFLAPVPFRGQTNTPLLVEHVYRYVANARCMDVNQLAKIIANNANEAFLQGLSN